MTQEEPVITLDMLQTAVGRLKILEKVKEENS